MTADPELLKNLKVGDKVAIRTRPIGFSREMGFQVWQVDHITPKRSKFVVSRRQKQGEGQPDRVFAMNFGAQGMCVEGERWSRTYYRLEPYNEAVLKSIIRDSTMVKVKNLLYEMHEAERDVKFVSLDQTKLDSMMEHTKALLELFK